MDKAEAAEIRQLRLQLAESERRREEAEQEIQQTTLEEYLEYCHKFIFTKLVVETDKNFTTKGPEANPSSKPVPACLAPWNDFLENQRIQLGTLFSAFDVGQTRLFDSRHHLRTLGDQFLDKKIGSEKDVEYFQHVSLENPVSSMVNMVVRVAGAKLNIRGKVRFENNPNGISDMNEEVVARLDARRKETGTSSTSTSTSTGLPDQICVLDIDGDPTKRHLVFVEEYKAPHKVTLPHLRSGLRPMDIYKEVVHRIEQPTKEDKEALFQYHADRLVAAVAVQTYQYMLENGLELSLLTTGEAFVFFKIDWNDPTCLYYHLADPGAEVYHHQDDFLYCTAVCQVLTFTLMALNSPGHGQDERGSAIGRLNKWAVTDEEIFRQIPLDSRSPPPSSPYRMPRTYDNARRSPIIPRSRNTRAAEVDMPYRSDARNRSPSSSDEDDARMQSTPTPAQRMRHGGGSNVPPPHQSRQAGTQGGSSRHGGGRNRPYCTQKCLSGLVRGDRLDESCPNITLHYRDSDGNHHPVSCAKWLELLKTQLACTLDQGITPLGTQGARGAIFKVTMLGYGYTLVCKSTVSAFVEDLEHEGDIYRQLDSLQGICVPVFLGSVDLRDIKRVYYYDVGVKLVYMIFLSWAGDSFEAAGENRVEKALDSLRALHAKWVVHTDAREPNLLWCAETGRVMVVDFERAILFDPPRASVTQLVPNKGPVASLKMGADKMGERWSSDRGFDSQTRNDVLTVKSIPS